MAGCPDRFNTETQRTRRNAEKSAFDGGVPGPDQRGDAADAEKRGEERIRWWRARARSRSTQRRGRRREKRGKAHSVAAGSDPFDAERNVPFAARPLAPPSAFLCFSLLFSAFLCVLRVSALNESVRPRRPPRLRPSPRRRSSRCIRRGSASPRQSFRARGGCLRPSLSARRRRAGPPSGASVLG
jgi:hypothetical protein